MPMRMTSVSSMSGIDAERLYGMIRNFYMHMTPYLLAWLQLTCDWLRAALHGLFSSPIPEIKPGQPGAPSFSTDNVCGVFKVLN